MQCFACFYTIVDGCVLIRIMPKTRHKKKQLNSYDEITRATVKQLAVTLADDEEDKYTCLQCTTFVDQVL